MSTAVKFKFNLGDKVVDETRSFGQGYGEVVRMEIEERGIFYAIKHGDRRWLAKEGALTAHRDYKPENPPALEPGEMA